MADDVFSKWWYSASSAQRDKLAKLAKTSRNYLDQVAGGHRHFSAEMAGVIEAAFEAWWFSETSRTRVKLNLSTLDLPTRGDLCKTCAGCDYYKNR